MQHGSAESTRVEGGGGLLAYWHFNRSPPMGTTSQVNVATTSMRLS